MRLLITQSKLEQIDCSAQARYKYPTPQPALGQSAYRAYRPAKRRDNIRIGTCCFEVVLAYKVGKTRFYLVKVYCGESSLFNSWVTIV